MKLPASRLVPRSAARLSGICALLCTIVCFSVFPLIADETPAPAATAQPSSAPDEPSATPAKDKSGKKGGPKQPKQPKSGASVSKDIPIPLPIGEVAHGLKIPTVDTAGLILSMLKAMKTTRVDDTHLRMEGTNIDLNKADGKSDYHIDIPACVFDTKTKIITSEDPVVIKTEDFELTGEKMKFDTVERSGEFLGKVRMRIHNLQQTAGVAQQQSTKNE